jgi:Tc toxin complex TcA C-terminal TcB-binding domain
MIPSFKVPASYFYALASSMPTTVSADVRYRLATAADEKSTLEQLRKALEDGVITADPNITLEMAARRLRSLGSTQGITPRCASGVGLALVQAYVSYKTLPVPNIDPKADIAPFWAGVITNPAQAAAHLELVMCAVTELPDSRPMILHVKSAPPAGAGLPLDDVRNLDPTPWPGPAVPDLDFDDWRTFFTLFPADLPPNTLPGTLDERIAAFVRRLRKFFSVAASGVGPTAPVVGAPPVLPRAQFDPIESFVAAYQAQPGQAGWTWGTPFDEPALQAALATIAMDPPGLRWLEQAVRAINELYTLTAIVAPPELRFSLTEALYARGFTTKAQIAALSLADFVDHLLGTVAYQHAGALYAEAGGTGGPPVPQPGSFKPVNPGDLVNCLPPCDVSPLGRTAYLADLLRLSSEATCDEPSNVATLGGVLLERRGNYGTMKVSCANAETPIPVVDLVNESLELMVANDTVSGVVYDTAGTILAGHHLREVDEPEDRDAVPYEHDPVTLFGALAEHSSPAVPVREPSAYTKLAGDFTAPVLPYAQALDLNRSYLGALGTTRFAVMRCFRKDITEFVLDSDPADEPAGFPRHQWRFPVRIDISREYLGISKEEYEVLFTVTPAPPLLQNLYGFDAGDATWLNTARLVSEFLRRTGLRYCEFLELWRSEIVKFHFLKPDQDRERAFALPECEPCYLDRVIIVFDDLSNEEGLARLAYIIRLWRKLQNVAGARYTFRELKDITTVLELFDGGGGVNPNFIRQLIAFQILRDEFHLQLYDRNDIEPGTGADRTHLLALWVPWAPNPPRKWAWAVEHLTARVERFTWKKHKRKPRAPEFLKLLANNLDALSRLGGFDPSVAARRWHTLPTHTLRFAELLAKIYASRFGVGEILYLFTADSHLAGDDPFPLDDRNESLENPLEHPDDEEEFSLWSLRRKLLEASVSDEDAEKWTWPRIAATLREELQFPPAGGNDPLHAFGAHFFPGIVERHGTAVPANDRRYSVPLAGSSAAMWNTPGSPFTYLDAPPDSALRAEIPFRDDAILNKLSRIRPLTGTERQAVRNLYYAPRLELAQFAYLFTSVGHADAHLIQELDEEARWSYFRRSFARFYARCNVIVEHLAGHVELITEHRSEDTRRLAWKLLAGLLGDENQADPPPWENDNGQRPPVLWNPQPVGSAFAALVGLIGTGLVGEYRTGDDKQLVWRELRGPAEAFGELRNEWNVPVPGIVPALDLNLTPEQQRWAQVRNGIAIAAASAKRLGGVEPYRVQWRGVLLVEHGGSYRFHGGTPTPEGEKPSIEHITGCRSWRVLLQRGEKAWVLISHHWPDELDCATSAALQLRRGAYDITIDFVHCGPGNDDLEEERPQDTGFQLKYEGPDTEDRVVTVPRRRLYVAKKDTQLSRGISDALSGVARNFLDAQYTSTLRDVRRTYQRAFKALLFAHRFGLSAKMFADYAQSEIGFMLDHPDVFAGMSFFDDGGVWKAHKANFDFNLLPLGDHFLPPPQAQDDRTAPSLRRTQALFDIWERTFDYTVLRRRAHKAPEDPVWLLFDEAARNQPDNPVHLLRHVAVDLNHAGLVLAFFNGFTVQASDLVDERWTIRVFHADRCLRKTVAHFAYEDIRQAQPALWAADDPTGAGNTNLTFIVRAGLIENRPPRRYDDLKKVDDGLRLRAREALLAYLCGMNRVALPWPAGGFATQPKHLSELLLIDVEAGICQRASRVEEAITAVQAYVQRARLGLEPPWTPSAGFIALWEGRYADYRTWQACIRRTLYSENWIQWDELEEARRTEAFRFLEEELRRATLTIPAPGGLEYWDAEELPPHPGFCLLQQREPSAIRLLDGPRQGLDLLGTPERSAQRSWLSPIHDRSTQIVPVDPRDDDRPSRTTGAPSTRGDNAPGIRAKLPLWIETAIRLGARFIRVAAAGVPPASMPFEPRPPRTREVCCRVCCCVHEAVVDEYYFWLVDSRWFDVIQQDPDFPGWHDVDALPLLLEWPSKPMVHLMWCRLHNGEIMQPRRSTEGVRVADGTLPGSVELELVGRTHDSLLFRVPAGVAPPGHLPAPDPGFRYDMAVDEAVVVPPVVAPPVNPPIPGNLSAYPFFAYVSPGAPLFPQNPFSEATAIAAALRAHCRWEAALKWYSVAFDPLRDDDRWCHRDRDPDRPADRPTDRPTDRPNQPEPVPVLTHVPGTVREEGECCRHGAVDPVIARKRAITLEYLETLLAWGDCLMERNSPEAFQQARLIYDTASRILGPTPLTVQLDSPEDLDMTVGGFIPDGPPLNPRLMSLYERVTDRLARIHACLTARRLRYGKPRVDMPYFGNDPARDGWETEAWTCGCAPDACCCPASPYRFMYLVDKANELAGEVRSLGAALLAAFEKGDAEYLTYVRTGHENQIATLMRAIRQDQWRDADWQVKALLKTKEIAQTNRTYYSMLVTNGLIAGEEDYQALVNAAIASISAATVSEAVGTVLGIIPDVFVGTTSFVQLPLGSKLAGVFNGIARISMDVSQILNTTAGLRLTQAGWERREDEWRHQIDIFDLELEQIERQILGAERRRDAALRELNVQQQQIENSREIVEILRDKFTNQQLYLWLQKETAALYYQMYELARCAARQAERAFNFERGYTTRRFLPAELWDDLRQGLLAGERLQLAVRSMEKAYLDVNVREYELTKHISLRLCFADSFLALKLTGCCIVEIPEWLFDLDYPGQYMRRVKNVSLTIPAVVGPYTGVHCRLTLLSSATRVDPRLHEPIGQCCEEEDPRPKPPKCGCWPPPRLAIKKPRPDASSNGYVPLREDARIVRQYAAREAIATSTAQNDTGMFELNFRDERYFPFEFAGVVSRWRIELPPENNRFDMDSLSDVVLHVNYTSREGGDPLRRAASEVAQTYIPDDGRRVFDPRREMPEEWARFVAQKGQQRFELRLERDMFPYLQTDREVRAHRFELFIAAAGATPSAHREVEFIPTHEKRCVHCGEEIEFQCIGGSEWPGFFHGVVDAEVHPLRGNEERHVGTFVFEERIEDIERAFLIVHYEVR